MFFFHSKAKLHWLKQFKMASNQQKKGRLIEGIEKKLIAKNFSLESRDKILGALDLLFSLAGIIFIVVIIRSFVMSPFQVYGISMCNTFNYIDGKCHDGFGDYLIINKSSYLQIGNWSTGKPERGDVIVFKPPYHNGEYYIKRVIGLPGETIRLIDGEVYLYNKKHPNGVKLQENYLNSENKGNTFASGGIDEFNVPENKYLVFGDNRKRSSDSRLCFKETLAGADCGENGITPFLSLTDIEGKASIALWPQPKVIETPKYPELN